VILPVVGLLLLLGLFWYWASTLIGDDSDNGSDVTPTTQAVIIDDTSTATATSTVAAGITPTEQANQPAGETPTESAGNTNQQGDETPTEEATQGSEEPVSTAFAIDDTVTTNDSVNMRSDPDASADNVIVTLDADTELTITGGPEEGPDGQGGNLVWWEVQDTATGDEGWVAEDYLEAS
jgi:hypothetical protein